MIRFRESATAFMEATLSLPKLTTFTGTGAPVNSRAGASLLCATLVLLTGPGLLPRAHAQDRPALSTEQTAMVQEANRLTEEVQRLYEGGQYRRAIPIAARAAALYEKVRGPEHPDVAQGLNDLAVLYQSVGRYDEAEPHHLRALVIRERALGPEHPDVAESLHNLAYLYKLQGQFTEAEPRYLRALAISEKTLGLEHPEVAQSRNNLAELYKSQGLYSRAEPHHLRALAIREKTLGAVHPHVAESLGNLGELYRLQGRYSEAEPHHLRALDIRAKALGSEHPLVANSLNSLAALYHSQGRYDGAESHFLRALTIWKKALGSEHPNVASTLNNLAEVYQSQGRYIEAETHYLSALDVSEKALGSRHPKVGITLNNLARLYESQGRFSEAESSLLRALAISENDSTTENPVVAIRLNNLAGLYESQRRYGEAELYYLRTLAIFEKVLGTEHRYVAANLNNLAGLYQLQGRYAEAEPHYLRALKILETALGAEHPQVAASLNNIALLYKSQGRYTEAEPRLLRALAIWEQTLGTEHPRVLKAVHNLTGLYLATDDLKRALDQANRAEGILDAHLGEMMTVGNEKHRQQYMAEHQYNVDTWMTLAVRAPARASELGLRATVHNKARVLDSMRATLAAIRDHLDDEGRALLSDYRDARTAYATQYLRGRQALTREQHHKNLAALEERKRAIEVALSQKSRTFGAVHRPPSMDDVRAAVPAGSALIEWIRYRPANARYTEPEDKWRAPHYAACALPGRGTSTCVDLGEARAIDDMAVALHRDLATSTDADARSRDLYQTILAPLIPHIGTARTLILSPDGMLHFVPFAALRHRRGGADRYLIEDYELTYITTSRDLARKAPAGVRPGRQPVTILGGPQYNVPGQNNGFRFSPIHGALREAKEIGAMYPDARVYTDVAATKAVLQAVHAPLMLLLSTHAYYGAQDCDGRVAPTDNPLLAAALALVGANACDDADARGRRQGIVTAEELAGLNLHGTELVVLSACDTGLGELGVSDQLSQQSDELKQRVIGIRDGVYGLRRALFLAGARTQMVSMWKVDDRVTHRLMVAYHQALQRGLGRAQALRQVQLAMLKNPRLRHPNLWASFVVVGDSAPLPTGTERTLGGLHRRGGCACRATERPAPVGGLLLLALALIAGTMRRCMNT